ncbi:Gfo/Idh/MocA family protein [Paenibacillus gansuensis]|uniref:Gfo/Idh/MocA family protein n=1 Tax=Paenibacillus gansuensis TaxID=306542 RepID=A0ABW5PAC5_9BACL
MTKRVKVGIIGLGEVAQIIHLPILQGMSELYEVTAICDVSEKLLHAIGNRYHIPNRYLKSKDLIADPQVDAVFVLNSDEYHTECILEAARQGKHVFVEKPMSLTEQDVHKVIKAKDDHGIKVMVGYMRRYAPAFQKALEEVRSMVKINFVRVRDIIGPNSYFIGQSTPVLRFSDIPDELRADKEERAAVLAKDALGDLAESYSSTYRLLCGLSSHDLSAMRNLLGMPMRVLAASRWNNGMFLSAVFEYEDYHVHFETGLDQQGRFDAGIEVFGNTKTVKIDYDTPYIRHLPVQVTIQETEGDSYKETVIRPTYTDPYTVELKHFWDALVLGTEIRTTPEDSLNDVKLFRMLIQAMEKTNRERQQLEQQPVI